MDVRDAISLGIGEAGPGREGQIGSQTVRCGQARPLTDQLSELTSAFEERYLRKALRKCRGHVGRCAKISGLSRRSISAKIAHYKIDTAAYKPK